LALGGFMRTFILKIQ